MVANSQTFNQRDNDNNDKDNVKTAAANAAPLDVDEKSHWAQFAAPGPLATPFNIDAEAIADAARAGVDETPDAESDDEASKRPEKTSETPKRTGLTKTVTHYDDGEFVCWLPNDVDAGAELARFAKAASKTAVRAALAEAKASLLTQVLTLPTPRRVADIRQYYHQSVQGLALSVLAALGTDDEKFAVDNYLANAMSGAASQPNDETPDDADVAEAKALVEAYKRIKVKPFLHLGKFYNRVAVPFIRNDAATFDRILKAIETVFAPNELIRPWNVADKTSAFCDALQNDGMTQAAALPLAKEAVAIATEAASALYWDGAGPEPKQRWKTACVKPAFNVEIGDALKPANVGDKTSFSVDAAEAEAGE